MKNAILAAVLTALFAAPALAGTFSIPDASPLASITVPDAGWKVTKIEKGVELESADDEVYLSIEGIKLKAIGELIADAMKVLQRGGVTIDPATRKDVAGKLLGYQFDDVGWSGKDKDGDVVIHLSVLTINPTDALLFTYWASPDGDKKHDPATKKMIESLTFTKPK